MSISELPVSQGASVSSALDGASASPGHPPDVLRDRLTAEFRAVAPERIGVLVEEAYARTRNAQVQAFRVLLAEREVREALRREASSQDGASTS